MVLPDPPPADEEGAASSPEAAPDSLSDDEDDDEPEGLDLATATGDGAASPAWLRAWSSSPSANGLGGRANVRWRRTSASVGAPCGKLGESDMVKAASTARPHP